MNDAQKFLQSLADNDEERQALHSALAADIVQAGKAKGYNFTEQDLENLMQPGAGGSGSALGVSIGWS